jgi:uncharacterized protein (TIGR04552 family)
MLNGLKLADVEAIRLVLSGASVIDWRRLLFTDREQVQGFLRVQEFQLEREEDRARLWALHARAVQYLDLSFGLRLPLAVLQPRAIEDLLLVASGEGDPAEQRGACMVLKVMHIVHQLDGRELGFRLPISDSEVYHLAEEKVLAAVHRMRLAGHPIVEAAVGRKLRDSLITKLLAKHGDIASQIYDKLRVRLVTAHRDNVLPLVKGLTDHLVPYNYVIPHESRNLLVDLRQEVERDPDLRAHLGRLQQGVGLEEGERPQPGPANEFSGGSYQDIAFVVDLPLRVPEEMWRTLGPEERALGPILFTLVEFQVLDEPTALENERGDGSHEAYKRRQLQRVMQRLTDGLLEG